MRPKVYLETSVVSYLVGRPSRDLVIAGRQQLTTEWWAQHRPRYDLHVSETVVHELTGGDHVAARQRLDAIDGIPVLRQTPGADALARTLIDRGVIPVEATIDAVHVAIAAANAMDFLLTWNFRHIANAVTRGRVERLIRSLGWESPVLCTPEELVDLP